MCDRALTKRSSIHDGVENSLEECVLAPLLGCFRLCLLHLRQHNTHFWHNRCKQMHLLLFESLVIHHLWAMCGVTSSLVTYVPLEHSDKHVPAWPLGQALQGPADKAAWMTLAPREEPAFRAMPPF